VRRRRLPAGRARGKRDFVDVKKDWIAHIAGFARASRR
jgi:hypothetical protein